MDVGARGADRLGCKIAQIQSARDQYGFQLWSRAGLLMSYGDSGSEHN